MSKQHKTAEAGTDSIAPRKSRKAIPKKRKTKAGPGRPKGSILLESGLTPTQEAVAEAIVDAEMKDGLWPASVKDIVAVTGRTSQYVRKLLKRDDFQQHLNSLLKIEGVILEGSFVRGIQLGLQVGDPKVLDLYARMTGKIHPVKKETKVEVVVTSPDGQTALPEYPADEVIEAEVVDEQ